MSQYNHLEDLKMSYKRNAVQPFKKLGTKNTKTKLQSMCFVLTVSQQIVPLNIFPRICLKICSGGYSERSGLRVFPQDLLMPCEVVRNWANLGMNMLQIFSPLQYLYTQIFSLPNLVSTFLLTNYLVTSDCFHWNLGNIICFLFMEPKTSHVLASK